MVEWNPPGLYVGVFFSLISDLQADNSSHAMRCKVVDSLFSVKVFPQNMDPGIGSRFGVPLHSTLNGRDIFSNSATVEGAVRDVTS